jgi:hypothetical protein
MQGLLEPETEPRDGWRGQTGMRRFWILAGAFAAAAVTLTLALTLGAWGFGYRLTSQHERRLRRVLEKQPTMAQLTEGLESEGIRVLSTPQTAGEVERAIADHGRDRAPELRQKARRWKHLRVFDASEMIYFVFFDDDGVMRDFTCVRG